MDFTNIPVYENKNQFENVNFYIINKKDNVYVITNVHWFVYMPFLTIRNINSDNLNTLAIHILHHILYT